jgi:hypothetical protein
MGHMNQHHIDAAVLPVLGVSSHHLRIILLHLKVGQAASRLLCSWQ